MAIIETFKNVLIADDDPDDQLMLKDIVSEYSGLINTTCIPDGKLLMEYLGTQPAPDLLFLDLNMPYKTGLQCLTEIRSDKKLKHIPVVIFSTSQNTQDIDMCFMNGAELFYSKPWDLNGFRKLVHSILDIDWTSFKRPASPKEFYELSSSGKINSLK